MNLTGDLLLYTHPNSVIIFVLSSLTPLRLTGKKAGDRIQKHNYLKIKENQSLGRIIWLAVLVCARATSLTGLVFKIPASSTRVAHRPFQIAIPLMKLFSRSVNMKSHTNQQEYVSHFTITKMFFRWIIFPHLFGEWCWQSYPRNCHTTSYWW